MNISELQIKTDIFIVFFFFSKCTAWRSELNTLGISVAACVLARNIITSRTKTLQRRLADCVLKDLPAYAVSEQLISKAFFL